MGSISDHPEQNRDVRDTGIIRESFEVLYDGSFVLRLSDPT